MRNTEFISKDTQLFVSLAEIPGNTGTVWFNKMFTEKKIDAVYKAFAVERDGFKSAFEGVRALKIAGGAISMPFKKRAFHWVDEVQGIAAKIGTINTFRRETSGKLLGWNTDYLAALKAIPLGCGKVYLLGAGGVAAAVALAASEKKVESLTVFSRNMGSHQIPKLVDFSWESWERQESMESPQVVINCTPLGMIPGGELSIPDHWWKNMKLAIDLTYRPEGNQFFRKAKEHQLFFLDGKQFARWQALEQFKIYTGIDLPEENCGY